MRFTAALIRGSTIDRMWCNHHRHGGMVNGVLFRWKAGAGFYSEELNADEVGRLEGHACVRLEIIAEAPTAAEPRIVPRESDEGSDDDDDDFEQLFGGSPEDAALPQETAAADAPRRRGRPPGRKQ